MVGGSDTEFRPSNPEHSSLVVDQTAWAKLRKSQEARSADHAARVVFSRLCFANSRNPRHERQAWEVVAREEALTGQIPESVKIAIVVASLVQMLELIDGIEITAFGVLPI